MADIAWSRGARQDLAALRDYLSGWSEEFASLFVERLVAALESLSDFPRRGRVVPEFQRDNLREVIYRNYRVIYELVDDNVVVLAVRHGSVDLERVITRRSWDLP